MLTQAYLKTLLNYNADTGIFTWLASGKGREASLRAGRKNTKDYIRITIEGVVYSAHRLAWLYMTGDWPSVQIDHKNLIKSDNRWSNIRLATKAQNQLNKTKISKKCASPYKGVTQYKNASGKCWKAECRLNGKKIYLGSFYSEEDAAVAYNQYASNIHGDFFRGNRVESKAH